MAVSPLAVAHLQVPRLKSRSSASLLLLGLYTAHYLFAFTAVTFPAIGQELREKSEDKAPATWTDRVFENLDSFGHHT